MHIPETEAELKGHVALNRLVAMLSLIGALLALHYAYTFPGMILKVVFASAAGALCNITVSRTIRAALFGSAIITRAAVEAAKKKGYFQS